jgi:hypothetical protein
VACARESLDLLDGTGEAWSPARVRLARVALALALFSRGALAADGPPASPLLAPDHWAVRAAGRLYELGLAPGWLPSQRAAPLVVVGRTLSAGAARAGREAPRHAGLARAWVERFGREFPRWERAGVDPAALAGVALGVGAAKGHVREEIPAARRPDLIALGAPRDGILGDLAGAATLGQHLAAGLRLHADASGVSSPSLEIVGALGPLALSVGRGPVGYGPSEVGAVVASGVAPIDRAELMTADPLPLGPLGYLALDAALARFTDARHPYHPLLWQFQAQWRPHPRLTLGVIRGLMFGGTPWGGISARDAVTGLLGVSNKAPTNNVYSLSAKYRLPSEALLPLTVNVEWGTDDNPGAAVQWPGIVAGISAPMLGPLPGSLGVEVAYFGRGPVGYRDPLAWYSHSSYTGGWVTGRTPLGDPLGGSGRALRLTGAADLWDARVRLSALAWVQDRFADNLHAPAAGGRSAGARGEAEWRFGPTSLGVRGSYEHGRDGWNRGDLVGEATVFF